MSAYTTHIMDSSARALDTYISINDKLLVPRNDGGVTESEDFKCQ